MAETEPPTFADMAVALTLASGKLKLDLAQTKIIAARVGLSAMGLAVVVDGLERDAQLAERRDARVLGHGGDCPHGFAEGEKLDDSVLKGGCDHGVSGAHVITAPA